MTRAHARILHRCPGAPPYVFIVAHTLQAIEEVVEVDFTEFLLEHEIEAMQSELESASSPDEAEEIEAVYARVAADRSQHPEQFMEYLQSLESGSGEAGAAPAEAAKPGKKVSKFQFRSGINDKRSWGEGRPADTASASSKQAEAAGSPAADTPVAPGAAAGSPSADAASGAAAAASDAAAEPGAAASSSSEASSAARSTARPASKALEAFDGFNPLKESQEAAFKRYESFAKTLAAESWSEMEGMKEHPEVAVLVKDLVRQIRSTTGDEKAEFNLEGLERMVGNLKPTGRVSAARLAGYLIVAAVGAMQLLPHDVLQCCCGTKHDRHSNLASPAPHFRSLNHCNCHHHAPTPVFAVPGRPRNACGRARRCGGSLL